MGSPIDTKLIGAARQVIVWGPPSDGMMPSDGRWCDEPAAGHDPEVVFHREAVYISGTSNCFCLHCRVMLCECEA